MPCTVQQAARAEEAVPTPREGGRALVSDVGVRTRAKESVGMGSAMRRQEGRAVGGPAGS